MSDWKQTLAAVAPELANAFGGPLGRAAAQFAVKALGCEPMDSHDEREEAVARAVSGNDPEALLKLKQAEIELLAFQQRIKEMDLEFQKSILSDKANARDREAKVGGNTATYLAFLIVLGFFGVTAYIVSGRVTLTDNVGTLITSLVSILGAKVGTVIEYYFGSSIDRDALRPTGK